MTTGTWEWLAAIAAVGLAGRRVWLVRVWRAGLAAWRLRLPAGVEVDQVARWLGTLPGMTRAGRWRLRGFARWPICMEVTATARGIDWVVLARSGWRDDLLASLTAVIPGARLDELPAHPEPKGRHGWTVAVETRLKGRSRLLAVDRAADASRHVIAGLHPLLLGERVCLQWVLAGVRPPWLALWRRAWLERRRRSWRRLPPPSPLVQRWRCGEPVLRAAGRVAVFTPSGRARGRAVLGRLQAGLRGMNTAGGYVGRRLLTTGAGVGRRVDRRAVPLWRWPWTATAAELSGVLGLAGAQGLPGVPLAVSRVLPSPPVMPAAGVLVGRGNYPGTATGLRLLPDDRLRHVWVAGPTGVGKSTLLGNLILQDAAGGDGLVVIDARGDLVTDVLARLPESRAGDVVVIDPSAAGPVVGFNPLAGADAERAAGFVLYVMQSIYHDWWGPRTADILRAALLTLTATRAVDGAGFTLCELPELLTETGFRRQVTRQPLPYGVAGFWRWYDSLSEAEQSHVIGPVLNKLRAFTLSTPLRLMLGQSVGLDFADVFTCRRIVLIALNRGLVGAETAVLIGSLALAALWQATLARAAIPAQRRRPAWLYLDEFQDIVRLPLDLADMLAQARGLGLGLTLAHQHLAQLSPVVRAAVLGTARTQVVFQLEREDAHTLAPRFAPLTADDLAGLAAHEIALRPCVHAATLSPVTGTTSPLPKPVRDPAELAAASRARHGVPRDRIEQDAAARLAVVSASRRPNRLAPAPSGPEQSA